MITIQSYFQIRYLTFKKIESLQNQESLNISNIKHELRMWENTDRSISAISKFDDISRSVIHSRVALLNKALQREIEGSDSKEHRNPSVYFDEFRSAQPSVDELIEDGNDKSNEKHEDLIRHLEEVVRRNNIGNIH